MTNLINKRIIENESLIYSIAKKYSNYYNIDDLFQAGCIGIIKADKKYDSKSNTKFSTYAYKYILGEIIDYIRKDRNIIISNESYEIYKKYIKIREMLTLKYEREISFSEICSYMNIDEKIMLNIIESISIMKSMDESTNNIYSSDDTENVDNEILLKYELESLDEEDKKLIDYRYYYGYSQSETASLMGISQSTASRQEKLILKKIKNNIAN